MKSKPPHGSQSEGSVLPNDTLTRTRGRPRIINPISQIDSTYVGNVPRDPREISRMRAELQLGLRSPEDRAVADMIYDWQQQVPISLLLTFVFNQLPGGPQARLIQMMRRIEEFYNVAIHQLLRYPNKPSNRDRLPLLIAVPESAWGQISKEIGHEIARPNDGDHAHAVFMPFPSRQSRMPSGFLHHLETEKHRLYIRPRDGERDKLSDIHAVRLDQRWGAVWKYMTKEGGRERRFADNILILPRAQSEL